MDDNCEQKKPCGCSDQPIGSKPICNSTCEKPACSEQFCVKCIVNCSPSSFSFNGVMIHPNEDVLTMMLKLAVGAPCAEEMVTGFTVINITTTSVTLQWNVTEEPSVILHVIPEDIAPYDVDVIGLTQFTLINLTPDTPLTAVITAGAHDCESVTINTKTLAE